MATHYQGTVEERLALDVYIKLLRASDSLTARVNKHLAEAKLTVSQFGVLEALYHLGPMHQNALGEKLLRSSGNMTMVIDNLCKRGLVERCRNTEDRRFVTIYLTDAGQELIHNIFPKHAALILEEVSILTPREQHDLNNLCRKLGLGKP